MSEKVQLDKIASGYVSVDTLNSNFTAIEEAINDALNLSGLQPNNMKSQLDMDSNKIINVADPVSATDAANLRTISEYFNEHTVDTDRVPIGTIPHSYLAGLLTSDDHTQYLNNTRGDARYYTQTIADSRYAYKTHTHLLGDISNWNDAMSNYYLSLSEGGVVESDVTIEGKFTLGGEEHTRLPKISSNTVFEDNDVLLYDAPSESWYGVTVTEFIGDLTVNSIFDIGDVVYQDTMTGGQELARGQYLRYGSVDGNPPYNWYNAQIKYTDVNGLVPTTALPFAIRNTAFLGDSELGLPLNTNAKLVINNENSSQWTTLSAGTATVGQVLKVYANSSGGKSVRFEDVSSTVVNLDDLADVNTGGATPTTNQVIKYDGAGDWKYSSLAFSDITGTLSGIQLPTTIQGIAATDLGRIDGNLVVWDTANSQWGELAATQTGTPLADTEHVLTLKANGQVNWTQYDLPDTADAFTCSDLNNCSVGQLSDVPQLTTSSPNNQVLIWNSTTGSYVAKNVSDHTHNPATVFSGYSTKIPFVVIPTGTTSNTVAIGDHNHNGEFQPWSILLDDLSGTNTGVNSTAPSAVDGLVGNILFKYYTSDGNVSHLGYSALPNPVGTTSNQYLGFDGLHSKPQWKTLPTSSGGAQYLYDLSDVGYVDNTDLAATTEPQMLYWESANGLGWTFAPAQDIVSGLYLAKTGGELTGPLDINTKGYIPHALRITSAQGYSNAAIDVYTQGSGHNAIRLYGALEDEPTGNLEGNFLLIDGFGRRGVCIDSSTLYEGIRIYKNSSSLIPSTVGIEVEGQHNTGISIDSDGSSEAIKLSGTNSTSAIYDTSTSSAYGIRMAGIGNLANVAAFTARNVPDSKGNRVGFYTDGVVKAAGFVDINGDSIETGGSGTEQNLYETVRYAAGIYNSSTDQYSIVGGSYGPNHTATTPSDILTLVGVGNIKIESTSSGSIKNFFISYEQDGGDETYVPTSGTESLTGWSGMTGELLITKQNDTDSILGNNFESNYTSKYDGRTPVAGQYTNLIESAANYNKVRFGDESSTITPSMGWQVNPGYTTGAANRGRSGSFANYTELVIRQGSAGDFAGYHANVNIRSSGADTHKYPGTDPTIAPLLNHYGVPAGICFNGQVVTQVDEVYLNPYETILKDISNAGQVNEYIAKDVRAVGAVYNMERHGKRTGPTNIGGDGSTQKYTTDSVYWDGLRIQSTGPEYCDEAIRVKGKWKGGLSFIETNMPADANAITLPNCVDGPGASIAMEPTGTIQIRYKAGFIEFLNGGVVKATINMSTGAYTP